MKKNLIALLALSFLAMSLPALAANEGNENGYHAVWLNGSYLPKGKGHPGGGFGFRGVNIGVEVSYIDSGDYAGDDINVIPPGTESFMGPSDSLGKKNIDGSLGVDFMLFLNPLKGVSVFAEGGLYYQETQQLQRAQNTGKLWSTHHSYNALGGGGGGIMVKIPTSEFLTFNGVSLQAGYHSLKGITASIGLTY